MADLEYEKADVPTTSSNRVSIFKLRRIGLHTLFRLLIALPYFEPGIRYANFYSLDVLALSQKYHYGTLSAHLCVVLVVLGSWLAPLLLIVASHHRQVILAVVIIAIYVVFDLSMTGQLPQAGLSSLLGLVVLSDPFAAILLENWASTAERPTEREKHSEELCVIYKLLAGTPGY
jgi:hypothetical protein